MRHAQIIYYVTTLLKHPEFPPGTPPQLQVRFDWLEPPSAKLVWVAGKASL